MMGLNISNFFSKVKEEFYCFFDPMYDEAVGWGIISFFQKNMDLKGMNFPGLTFWMNSLCKKSMEYFSKSIQIDPLENISHYDHIWKRIFAYHPSPPITPREIALFFDGLQKVKDEYTVSVFFQ